MKQSLRTTIQTIKADFLTPVLVFQRLQGTHKFLFESSSKYEENGRYSFIGANPRKTYFGSDETLYDLSHETKQQYTYAGLIQQSLKQVMPRVLSNTVFPFVGGAIGYASNEAVVFDIYDTVIIFDHITDEATIVHTNITAESVSPNLNEMIEQITTASPISSDGYAAVIKNTQTANHLVISEASFQGEPFELYRQLRTKIQGAYMYYIQLLDEVYIGSSTESFISVANETVKTKQSEKIQHLLTKEGTLQPGLHSLDALYTLLPAQQLQAIGYIGFNGQIDFTLASTVIRIKKDQANITANKHTNTLLAELFEQVKG